MSDFLVMTLQQIEAEAESDRIFWDKHLKHEKLHFKRVFNLVLKLTSKKFLSALKAEFEEADFYPVRVVRLRDIKRKKTFHGHLRRIHYRVHKQITRDYSPWNHTFHWQEGPGIAGDDYSGEVFFPLGKGCYLRCWFQT